MPPADAQSIVLNYDTQQTTLRACADASRARKLQQPRAADLPATESVATAYEGGQIDESVPSATVPEGVDLAQGADQEGAGDWRDACGSGGSVIEDDRMGQNPSGEQYRFTIEEMRLARKLGQIIGFHFDIEEFSEPAGPAQKM